LDNQNNYVGRSSWLLECQKHFCSIARWIFYIIILMILMIRKLFLDLYLL